MYGRAFIHLLIELENTVLQKSYNIHLTDSIGRKGKSLVNLSYYQGKLNIRVQGRISSDNAGKIWVVFANTENFFCFDKHAGFSLDQR
jgi:hypothetical protein